MPSSIDATDLNALAAAALADWRADQVDSAAIWKLHDVLRAIDDGGVLALTFTFLSLLDENDRLSQQVAEEERHG